MLKLACATHPAWAEPVASITELYVQARYAGHPEAVPELAKAVRGLRL